jgi:hypothetical protein
VIVPNDPQAPPEFLVITKRSAALTQLETAITIWFAYGDPVSISALAYAAQDCYAALSSHIKRPSLYNAWFESRPKGFQKRVRGILAFFKHGQRELKGKVRLPTSLAEILIGDSIQCHEALFQEKTPLMRFFEARFALENPSTVTGPLAFAVRKQAEIYDFANRDRVYFLNKARKLSE